MCEFSRVNQNFDVILNKDYLVQKKDESDSITVKDFRECMSDGKPPTLTCGSFNGREKDKFALHNFLNQFNNVIGSRKHLSASAKMSYLVGYLKMYALKQVSHLSITDENYSVALQLLNDEFLDKEFIIDETLKNILKTMPSDDYDAEFTNVKYFIAEVRSYLYELQRYTVDFLEEGTAGNIFVSHIIMSKLPKELIRSQKLIPP